MLQDYARLCLADVTLKNVFSNEMLQTAKKRALAFYEQLYKYKANTKKACVE